MDREMVTGIALPKKGGMVTARRNYMNFLTRTIAAIFELSFEHPYSDLLINKVFINQADQSYCADNGANYSTSNFNRHVFLRGKCVWTRLALHTPSGSFIANYVAYFSRPRPKNSATKIQLDEKPNVGRASILGRAIA
jgi:hypothetical protein